MSSLTSEPSMITRFLSSRLNTSLRGSNAPSSASGMGAVMTAGYPRRRSCELLREGRCGVEGDEHARPQAREIHALGALLTRLVAGVDAVHDACRLPRVEGAVVGDVREIGAGGRRVARSQLRPP